MEEEEEGRVDRLKVGTGFLAWWIFVWITTYLTGWGPGDPAFWGLIIISFPVGMIVGWLAWKKKE